MAVSTEAKVGLMMVIVLILLTILVFGVGDIGLFSSGYDINVLFSSTGGIESGSAVRLAGVKCGTVKEITFTDTVEEGKKVTLILATLKLDKGTQVHKDSSISISSTGILADKYVNITPGTPGSPLVEEGAVFRGVDQGDIPQLVAKGEQIADKIDQALSGLNQILDAKTTSDVKNTLENLSAFSNDLRVAGPNLTAALANLNKLSGRLDRIVTDNEQNISKTMSDLQLLSDQLLVVTESFDRTSVYLENVTRRLDQGEGTLGKLINRDDLYNDLRLMVADGQALIKDIREHPTRYINLSIF